MNRLNAELNDLLAALPLAGVIDLAAERARLDKELGKIAEDISRIDRKLENAMRIAAAARASAAAASAASRLPAMRL